MTLNSSEYLAIAMGSAMSGGTGYQYEATSTCQHGNNVEQFAIVVHPKALRWSSTSLRTGRTQSFEPMTLSLHDGEDTTQLSLDRIPHSFAEAVQLAFPMSLPIWGRHLDEYHPISAEQYESETVLILRHQKDRGLFGSLVFDPDTGTKPKLNPSLFEVVGSFTSWCRARVGVASLFAIARVSGSPVMFGPDPAT